MGPSPDLGTVLDDVRFAPDFVAEVG